MCYDERDLNEYECKLYDPCFGLDLESFSALMFCERNGLDGVALLCCVDNPEHKIRDESRKGLRGGVEGKIELMNRVGYGVLV